MRQFLNGLFWDQRGRAMRMRDELSRLARLPTLPVVFVEDTCMKLDFLSEKLDKILNDHLQLFNDLTSISPADAERLYDDYNVGQVVDYTKFSEALEKAEFNYTVIRRYGEAEAEFSRFLARIYDEINLTKPLPVVSFISNAHDYYWAYCPQGVIGAPIEEEHHLLNWPDLYHEIGHFIFERHERFLLGDGQMTRLVNDHFAPYIANATTPEAVTQWTDRRAHWLEHWLMEFSCDLIATYLTGQAYAWSNFRLSSIIPDDNSRHIYTSQITHPPNESRMRAILTMLDRCGWPENDLMPLKKAWEKHKLLSLNVEPADYTAIAPNALIDALADFVYNECCHEIGLHGYHDQLKKAAINVPVSHLLNVAWNQLLTNPTGYAAWEADQIRQLRNDGSDAPA
ncbi:hypothetical protein [Fibrella forsythiae]|uniref:Uncharacterized protein n=1 Tax=Fibrella forsythiae TaxID=2817061 RepID=A0ABS3JJG4_9BACT|nr:hypothetical protein [Fibrella forsythiae]MBO0950127.1 hypothetical protein [Fibrella forsythiae]